MANVTKPFLGSVRFQKVGGQGSPPIGTQYNIPIARCMPRNPLNKAYPPVVNKSAYPSVTVQGKRTPSASLSSFAKASWFSSTFLNSLLILLDANNDTDRYSIGFDDANTIRTYSNGGCAGISIYQTAVGGPITIDQQWLFNAGESEGAIPTWQAASTDAGQLENVSQVNFAGTADMVRSWRLDLIRGQGYVFFDDTTFYPNSIASGMFGGTLTLEQSPLFSVTPGSSVTIQVGSSGSGVNFALLLSTDELVWNQDTSFGTQVRTYTLIDTGAGGNPCVISAF